MLMVNSFSRRERKERKEKMEGMAFVMDYMYAIGPQA